MAASKFGNWEQYLATEDYAYLIQYIENIKNGVSNDKMMIFAGPGRTGKTTLKYNIVSYLGEELCRGYPMSGEFIYDESIKPLGLFCGIEDISRSKKNNQAIINFIKYKQSFIADTIHIERVNKKLLEHSKIITFTHVF